MAVCLHDFHTTESLVCSNSDHEGKYVLPAPKGLTVYVVVTLKTHTHFVRTKTSKGVDQSLDRTKFTRDAKEPLNMQLPDIKLPQGSSAKADQEPETPEKELTKEVFTIDATTTEETWRQMDYEDHTTRSVRLDAHGTLCRRRLADRSVFSFRYTQKSCYSEIPPTIMDTRNSVDAKYLVPAHAFDITLDSTILGGTYTLQQNYV